MTHMLNIKCMNALGLNILKAIDVAKFYSYQVNKTLKNRLEKVGIDYDKEVEKLRAQQKKYQDVAQEKKIIAGITSSIQKNVLAAEIEEQKLPIKLNLEIPDQNVTDDGVQRVCNPKLHFNVVHDTTPDERLPIEYTFRVVKHISQTAKSSSVSFNDLFKTYINEILKGYNLSEETFNGEIFFERSIFVDQRNTILEFNTRLENNVLFIQDAFVEYFLRNNGVVLDEIPLDACDLPINLFMTDFEIDTYILIHINFIKAYIIPGFTTPISCCDYNINPSNTADCCVFGDLLKNTYKGTNTSNLVSKLQSREYNIMKHLFSGGFFGYTIHLIPKIIKNAPLLSITRVSPALQLVHTNNQTFIRDFPKVILNQTTCQLITYKGQLAIHSEIVQSMIFDASKTLNQPPINLDISHLILPKEFIINSNVSKVSLSLCSRSNSPNHLNDLYLVIEGTDFGFVSDGLFIEVVKLAINLNPLAGRTGSLPINLPLITGLVRTGQCPYIGLLFFGISNSIVKGTVTEGLAKKFSILFPNFVPTCEFDSRYHATHIRDSKVLSEFINSLVLSNSTGDAQSPPRNLLWEDIHELLFFLPSTLYLRYPFTNDYLETEEIVKWLVSRSNLWKTTVFNEENRTISIQYQTSIPGSRQYKKTPKKISEQKFRCQVHENTGIYLNCQACREKIYRVFSDPLRKKTYSDIFTFPQYFRGEIIIMDMVSYPTYHECFICHAKYFSSVYANLCRRSHDHGIRGNIRPQHLIPTLIPGLSFLPSDLLLSPDELFQAWMRKLSLKTTSDSQPLNSVVRKLHHLSIFGTNKFIGRSHLSQCFHLTPNGFETVHEGLAHHVESLNQTVNKIRNILLSHNKGITNLEHPMIQEIFKTKLFNNVLRIECDI